MVQACECIRHMVLAMAAMLPEQLCLGAMLQVIAVCGYVGRCSCLTVELDCRQSDQMTMECFSGRAEVWRKRRSQLQGVEAVLAYVCRTEV